MSMMASVIMFFSSKAIISELPLYDTKLSHCVHSKYMSMYKIDNSYLSALLTRISRKFCSVLFFFENAPLIWMLGSPAFCKSS